VIVDRPWVLLLAFVPLLWIALDWRRTSASGGRRAGLILKALSVIAIILAIASPRIPWRATNVATAVLVDTSASVPAADLDRAAKLATQFEQARGGGIGSGNWMRVLPFAKDVRGTGSPGDAKAAVPDSAKTNITKNVRFENVRGADGRGTNLEAAVREAASTIPPGWLPRLVLVSDGQENSGSMARGAWQARQLGIPIDTFALPGRPRPSLRLESVSLPAAAFTGEQFPVDLMVTAPKPVQAEVELSAEGRLVGSSQVQLGEGVNPVRLHARLDVPGTFDLSVVMRTIPAGAAPASADAASDIRFDQQMTIKRPRVLFVSGDTDDLDSQLLQTLMVGQFQVTRSEIDKPQKFSIPNIADYQLVIFNNWELDLMPQAEQDRIEQYVRKGGGLLVIGGERSVYPENKRKSDALERVLPAKLIPPKSPDGRTVVLIIDRSTSMTGGKINYARISAAGVVSNLRPTDQIGVLVFDTTFLWQIPLRYADDREGINWMIGGIYANGGTRIGPALVEAYRNILEADGIFKHILLITDGLSEEGNTMNLAREAAQNGITISTVAIGRDANSRFLERLAQAGGGKNYAVENPAALQSIVLADVMEHTGSTAIERPVTPIVTHQAEILDGLNMSSAPPLKGYIRFETKPSAQTILKADAKDPLLTRWQYGLGRSAIFTSDAKSRWASDWITWKGYDKFWANLCRDLLPHKQASEAKLELDPATGQLIATYKLGEEIDEPQQVPELFVLGPEKYVQAVAVKKVSSRTYQGKVEIGARQGLFRVRPVMDSAAFPEVALYRPEAEMDQFGANETLLKQVSTITGGRFQPDPKSIFDAGGRTRVYAAQLWPGLLALAILLNVAELLLRKWKALFHRDPAPRA
jgi:uncharacterized membrane protein